MTNPDSDVFLASGTQWCGFIVFGDDMEEFSSRFISCVKVKLLQI